MRYVKMIIVVLIFLAGCHVPKTESIDYHEEEAMYSCDCTDTIVTGSKIKKFKGIVEGRSTRYYSVSDAEENAFGDRSHGARIKRKKLFLVNDTIVLKHLEKLLADLVAVRQNPSAIKYFIHLVEEKEIGSSISGGHIYITTKLYNKCKDNDDVLYALIGHEIGHTERGHGKFAVLELKFFSMTHPDRDSTYEDDFIPMSSTSSNQKFEFEADYYGINLVNLLHRDPCAVISFWNEMGKHEYRYDFLRRFLSSHPFS